MATIYIDPNTGAQTDTAPAATIDIDGQTVTRQVLELTLPAGVADVADLSGLAYRMLDEYRAIRERRARAAGQAPQPTPIYAKVTLASNPAPTP